MENMKLNEGFLDSMKEAFALFRKNDPAAAAEFVKRAMHGEQTNVARTRNDADIGIDIDKARTRFTDVFRARRPSQPARTDAFVRRGGAEGGDD